jgi:PHD/YefM family antitoxin component YafN of YafNO toxin-antitoxin module
MAEKSKSETGLKLNNMIKKAIDDHQITVTEYERILMLADEDGVIDAQEKRLLSELHSMISNGAVKKVRD